MKNRIVELKNCSDGRLVEVALVSFGALTAMIDGIAMYTSSDEEAVDTFNELLVDAGRHGFIINRRETFGV